MNDIPPVDHRTGQDNFPLKVPEESKGNRKVSQPSELGKTDQHIHRVAMLVISPSRSN